MYIQEISFQIATNFDLDSVETEFHTLIVSYRNNGQIQDSSINHIFINGENKVICTAITIAKDALNKKFNSEAISSNIKKIEQLFNTKLEYQLIGEALVNKEEQCKCKKSEFYILYTNFLAIGSPIMCGSCFNDVPLYKLPKYDEYGYTPILSWESNYKSCDTLQIGCSVGEVWAMKQMWRADSQLSKQGIDICKKLTELTNTPTFYYLFNYRSIRHSKDIKRKCPCCGGEWLLQEKLHNIFDFKCDNCNLISSLSDNSY